MSTIGYVGRDLQIFYNDTLIAAVRTKAVSKSREPIITSDEEGDGWRYIDALPDVRSTQIQVSGVATSENYSWLVAVWLGSTLTDIDIVHANGQVESAADGAYLQALSFLGESNGYVAFEATFILSGLVTITDSPYTTIVELTTPGSSSFVVPAGVTSIDLLLIGAGGSGGVDGGGGGGGGVLEVLGFEVVPGETIDYEIGAGGVAVGALSSAGGDTEWNYVLPGPVPEYVAVGGGGGGGVNGQAGGDGGSGGGGAQGGGDPEGDGTPGQGNDGGPGDYSGSVGFRNSRVGGGGGGAGSAGGPAVRIDITQPSTCTSGAGGAGLDVSERWGTAVGMNGVVAAGGVGGGPTTGDPGGTNIGDVAFAGAGLNNDAPAGTGSGGGASGGTIDNNLGDGSDGLILIGY